MSEGPGTAQSHHTGSQACGFAQTRQSRNTCPSQKSPGKRGTDNAEELTLTARGRFLTVVMYRQLLSGMNNLRGQARANLKGPEHELLFGDGTPVA